jgi:TonB family protein
MAIVVAAAAWLAVTPSATAQQLRSRHDAAELFPNTPPLRLRSRAALARDIAALYPSGLRDRGITGDVLVNILILHDGRVDTASVQLEHATDSAFVEPAVAVAKRLRFEPLGRELVRTHFPIHFAPPTLAQPPADDTWELWTVDELPHLSVGEYLGPRMIARYPPALKEAGTPGDVLVRFRINRTGTVDSASVSVLQATNAEFAAAAMAVARTVRFSPAQLGRRPVPVWFTLPLHFRLPPPAPAEVPPDEGIYELAAIEVQPRLRNRADVERFIISAYPASMAGTGVTGTVKVRFRIQENGTPESVQVVEASRPEFGPPAIEATRRMRFTPARINDRPVRVWAEIPIYFHPPESISTARDSAGRPPAPR